jgi:anti-sigma factor RsiW
MSECTNLEMRDLLPDFARGALTGASSVAVEVHLATCADCRAELCVLRDARSVLDRAPAIDAPRIVAAIARSSAVRREATTSVAQARRRRAWSVSAPSRRVWLAAASIAAVVGAAALARSNMRNPTTADPSPIAVQTEQPSTTAVVVTAPTRPVSPRPATQAELVMGGGVSDLADADLESLLHALDDVDTQLDVEPAVLLPVLEGDA